MLRSFAYTINSATDNADGFSLAVLRPKVCDRPSQSPALLHYHASQLACSRAPCCIECSFMAHVHLSPEAGEQRAALVLFQKKI